MEPDVIVADPGYSIDVMFIGEAPGAEEDRLGKPFIGKSGQLLRELVDVSGLSSYNVMYTNAVRCRPPNNKTPSVRQLKKCQQLLLDEIADHNPLVVVLLGNTPLKSVLNESGITNWRGVIVERDGRTYIPTFHPAYILRNPASLEIVADDIERVYGVVSGDSDESGGVDEEYEILLVDTLAKAQAMRADITRARLCSFDTETTSLRPYDVGQRIVMCSFAIDEPVKRAWAVDVKDRKIEQVVCDILNDGNIAKVGHNIKFDAMAVYLLWGVWIDGIIGDTMLMSYILDSQPGRHGLKMLAGRHLGMYAYDEPLRDYLARHKGADPTKGGNFGLVPPDILSEYTAKDVIATIELYRLFGEELTDEQTILLTELLMPASASLTAIQCNGVKVDREVLYDYITVYEREQEEVLRAIRNDPKVAAYSISRQRDGSSKSFEFNPNSYDQMRAVLYGALYYGLEPLGHTDTGKPSVAWDYVKPYANKVPFVRDYRVYKVLGKALGTYLRPAWSEQPSTFDGLIRSSYLLHGTVTGRLSSRGPNLQNIPTPEKEPGTLLASHPVKNIFTHRHPLGQLMVADYSGMELRTMAAVADCRGMKDVFRGGQDLHSIVTCHLYGLDYDEFMADLKGDNSIEAADAAKAKRYRAKWVNWTLLYGGSEYTLCRLYGLEERDATDLVRKYYDLFPEVLEYKDATLAFARSHGYVESRFKRRRYLPYINDPPGGSRSKAEREAINMPIQSVASDILLCALIVLDDLLLDDGFQSLMVNTVHDSVMFDVYPGELSDLGELVKEVMEGMITYYGPIRFPGLDFSWFDVPLKVDIEVGSHYGSLGSL